MGSTLNSITSFSEKITPRSDIARSPFEPDTHYHLNRLGRDRSILLHSWLMLNASNEIRTNIEKGKYDNMKPEEWYKEFYKIHGGRQDDRYHRIARFTPGAMLYGDYKVHLRDMPLGHFDINQGFRPQDNEMQMVRGQQE